MQCVIQWIDDKGNPTPDTNPAIARIKVRGHNTEIGGRMIWIDESEIFACCADHLREMPNDGYWVIVETL